MASCAWPRVGTASCAVHDGIAIGEAGTPQPMRQVDGGAFESADDVKGAVEMALDMLRASALATCAGAADVEPVCFSPGLAKVDFDRGRFAQPPGKFLYSVF